METSEKQEEKDIKEDEKNAILYYKLLILQTIVKKTN